METTRIIERYLEGTLDEAACREVEKRAEHDEQFRELIRLHGEVNASIRDRDLHHFRALVRKVGREYFATGDTACTGSSGKLSRKFIRSALRIAALIICCAAAGYVLKIAVISNPSPERLYNRYYTAYEPDIVSRSATVEILPMQKALANYTAGSYAEALATFDAIILQDRKNYLVWFYRGLTFMEMQDPANAVRSFRSIPVDWHSPFNEHRNWYLALALLRDNKPCESSGILIQIGRDGGYYARRAEKILKQLNC